MARRVGDLRKRTKAELLLMCRSLGLSPTGKKEELAQRVLGALEKGHSTAEEDVPEGVVASSDSEGPVEWD